MFDREILYIYVYICDFTVRTETDLTSFPSTEHDPAKMRLTFYVKSNPHPVIFIYLAWEKISEKHVGWRDDEGTSC